MLVIHLTSTCPRLSFLAGPIQVKGDDSDSGAGQAKPNPNALSLQDIIGLLTNHVASARIAELVEQYGLKFPPSAADLEKIRKAGGGDALMETIRRSASANP